MKKNNLYTAIEQFTPTKTEQKRAQAYQDEMTRISKHIGELEVEGQKLLAGVTNETAMSGNYRNSDRVEQIKKKLTVLRHELKCMAIQKPIFDDEYHDICGKLDTVSQELENTEERYSASLKEIERSRGVVPYDMFQQTSAESYAFAQKIEELKKEQSELTNSKNNYVRKTDRLFDQYKAEKTAEMKQHIRDTIHELIDYTREGCTEMSIAETITAGRKGEKVVSLPIAFGGDVLKNVSQKLEYILGLVERG